jgi:hypothetical protein
MASNDSDALSRITTCARVNAMAVDGRFTLSQQIKEVESLTTLIFGVTG